MAQVNAGRVRFVSRGEYNNSTQYYLFDLVDYNGSSYFAKANTTGNVPTNTTYWQLVAEKGNTGGDGPVGPTGNGIASIIKTASAGLIDTYTITFTNGSTTTFNVTNGQDGDVTQEYVDEENERLKSVFNVLPKVNGSGESVTLENTGDTMLYKMDLKGNTSQEVIQGEVGLEEEDTSIYVDDVNEDKENYITLKGNTYQDGEPTPDAPIPVNVVSGDNEITIINKNLFHDYTDTYTLRGITLTKGENELILNGTYNKTYNGDYWLTKSVNSTSYNDNIILLKANTTYSFKIEFVEGTMTGSPNCVLSSRTASDKTFAWNYRTIAKGTNGYQDTWTPTEDIYLAAIRFPVQPAMNFVCNNLKIRIQVEKSSVPTPYEPYQSQTYPINLGNIELCKIGTYQDRIYKSNGNWYLHKEIGKVVLDGSENWQQSGYTNETIYSTYSQLNDYKQSSVFISNLFTYVSNVDGTTSVEYISTGGDSIRIGIFKSRLTAYTINEFKTWLSNNNVTIYYPLATPTETQITDTTLVNQLEALYQAQIHSITHINTETSNLLPYIDLKYNVVTASPSPERASEVEVVKGNNTITISNEDGTKTQSYNITLGNLELCKIGNYQDYLFKDNGKWYLHKEIGKIVLNGSENITTTTYSAGAYFHNIINIGLNGTNNDYAISNYYTYSSSYMNNTCKTANGGKELVTRDNFDQSTYITWLGTNKPIFYYLLATPTTTQITDQLLVSQLDELQKAMSYYDKTLITQTNAKKPFILDVVGIRDLQNIFNL